MWGSIARVVLRRGVDGIAKPDDPRRARKLGMFLLVLVGGWLFILKNNSFHVSAPVVFVCLGYLAVITTVMNLWRTGASAVAPEDATEAAWTAPIGPRGELEKEKKTLLKAIKEAEFDHQMGKLSKADADEMIATYRARAIEVIKGIDRLDAGQAETTRDVIEREVRARLEVHKAGPVKKKAVVATEAAPTEAVTDSTAKEATS